MQIYWKY